MAQPPPEDKNLAPEQFPDLNRQFYAGAGPHAYLEHRLRALFLAAQPPEDLGAGLDGGLAIGGVRASWSSDEPWDAKESRDYVSTETTVLMHHSAEALFRLYFAHAGTPSPACPWLEVARLRIPRHFKERVEEFVEKAGAPETGASLMNVFVGHPKPNQPEHTEQWESFRDGLVLLTGHLARMLLDEGPLYNAAKHGLAVRPGAAAMTIGEPDGPVAIRTDGPSITYLTVGTGQQGKRWRQATNWLDVEQSLVLISTANRQLANLWHIAQYRYTGAPFVEAEVQSFTKDTISRILHPPRNEGVTFSVPSMSMDLLYYADE